MRVVVTGASGSVGGPLVSALREAGHEALASVRDADRYDPPARIEVRQGDLLEYLPVAPGTPGTCGAFDIGGPDVLTREAARVALRERPVAAEHTDPPTVGGA